jgi:hypothetical protein
VLATLIMIALFFAGMVPAKAAIIIGGLLLLTRLVKSRRIYEEIDWSLLLASIGVDFSKTSLLLAPAGSKPNRINRHRPLRGRLPASGIMGNLFSGRPPQIEGVRLIDAEFRS